MFNNLIVSAKLEAYIRSLIVNTQGDPIREEQWQDYEKMLDEWIEEIDELFEGDDPLYDEHGHMVDEGDTDEQG